MDCLKLPEKHGLAIGAHPKEKINPDVLSKCLEKAALFAKEHKLFGLGEAGKSVYVVFLIFCSTLFKHNFLRDLCTEFLNSWAQMKAENLRNPKLSLIGQIYLIATVETVQ